MSSAADIAISGVEPLTVPRTVRIRPFLAGDVVQLALQPSQHTALGMTRTVHDLDDGRELEQRSPEAWTAVGPDGRTLCCAGLAMLWDPGPKTGGHAMAWALLANAIGPAHLAMTRFFARVIANSPITRIEAIVRADYPAERRWVRLVGLHQAAELRAWGPDGETHLLFDRVRPFPSEQE